MYAPQPAPPRRDPIPVDPGLAAAGATTARALVRRAPRRRWAAGIGVTVLAAAGLLVGTPTSPAGPASASASAAPAAQAVTVSGEGCAPAEGVTVVVDFGALGGVVVGCAPGQQANGVAALAAAGFSVAPGTGPGTVCTIDGQPVQGYPYCWVTGGYWSYWKKGWGSAWGFSGVGPGAGPLAVDSIEGWYWAEGFQSSTPRADETTAPPTTAPPTTATPTTAPTTEPAPTTSTPSTSTTPESTTTTGGDGSTVPSTPTGPTGPTSTPGTGSLPVAAPAPGGVRPAGSAATPRAAGALARTGGDPTTGLVAGLVVLAAGVAVGAANRRLHRP